MFTGTHTNLNPTETNGNNNNDDDDNNNNSYNGAHARASTRRT